MDPIPIPPHARRSREQNSVRKKSQWNRDGRPLNKVKIPTGDKLKEGNTKPEIRGGSQVNLCGCRCGGNVRNGWLVHSMLINLARRFVSHTPPLLP